MAKVSELKERARAFEQQGKLGEALAIYRHILNHLERTPAIKHELPLYVKVGDLSLKLGNPTWAVSMYERAAGHYVEVGSGKTLVSLCHKIVRVDESRSNVFREYAEQLLAAGHLQAAVVVLQEHAKRVKRPEVFVRLQGVVDRPDDDTRRALQDALAELDGKAVAPPAAAAPPRAAAAPPPSQPRPKAPSGLITEPQLEGGRKSTPQPAHVGPVTPPRIPALKVPPAPPPQPPRPPQRVEVEPGPFSPPARRPGSTSGPQRTVEERRPGSTSGPQRVVAQHPPARRVMTDVGPTGGRVVVRQAKPRRGRLLWIGGLASVVVVAAVAAVLLLSRGPSAGGRGASPSPVRPVPAPPPAPSESVAVTQPTGPVAQVPTDTAQATDTSRAAPPVVSQPPAQPPARPPAATPRPAPARVPSPPAPITVQLPEGATVSGIFVVINGLPIDSVSDLVMDGRAGYRVVQRLQSGETLVLTAVPVPPGSDSVGLGAPQVMSMFGDVIGARRYWGYQVNVRGSVAEDVLSRLLGRLVRARGGS